MDIADFFIKMGEYCAAVKNEDADKKKVTWESCEMMSKDFAMAVIEDIREFYIRLHDHTEEKPFKNETDYYERLNLINGLRSYVECWGR